MLVLFTQSCYHVHLKLPKVTASVLSQKGKVAVSHDETWSGMQNAHTLELNAS